MRLVVYGLGFWVYKCNGLRSATGFAGSLLTSGFAADSEPSVLTRPTCLGFPKPCPRQPGSKTNEPYSVW